MVQREREREGTFAGQGEERNGKRGRICRWERGLSRRGTPRVWEWRFPTSPRKQARRNSQRSTMTMMMTSPSGLAICVVAKVVSDYEKPLRNGCGVIYSLCVVLCRVCEHSVLLLLLFSNPALFLDLLRLSHSSSCFHPLITVRFPFIYQNKLK